MKTALMIGDNVTEVDYQVIDKNGKIHNYIWDDEQRKMVEGKREKSIPWWQLHQIANNLKGELVTKTIVDSRGNVSKQIVIEYKEEE
jgi:hypothetical protein